MAAGMGSTAVGANIQQDNWVFNGSFGSRWEAQADRLASLEAMDAGTSGGLMAAEYNSAVNGGLISSDKVAAEAGHNVALAWKKLRAGG